MPILATALQAYGATQNGGKSQTASSGIASSGSYYNISSGGTGNSPLISNGLSTTNMLIIGAVVLGALFLMKK